MGKTRDSFFGLSVCCSHTNRAPPSLLIDTDQTFSMILLPSSFYFLSLGNRLSFEFSNTDQFRRPTQHRIAFRKSKKPPLSISASTFSAQNLVRRIPHPLTSFSVSSEISVHLGVVGGAGFSSPSLANPLTHKG